MWVQGLFADKPFPDLTIFRQRMKHAVQPGDKDVTDRVYQDPSCLLWNDVDFAKRKMLVTARDKQETISRRFMQFFVLGNRFRHGIALHSACFHAAANITQIESGSPLFGLITRNEDSFWVYLDWKNFHLVGVLSCGHPWN